MMMASKTIEATVRFAWPKGYRVAAHRVRIGRDGIPTVWDAVAQHYVPITGLSARTVARIATRAREVQS